MNLCLEGLCQIVTAHFILFLCMFCWVLKMSLFKDCKSPAHGELQLPLKKRKAGENVPPTLTATSTTSQNGQSEDSQFLLNPSES